MNRLDLKNKTILLISILLVATVVIISSIAIWSIRDKGMRDIRSYREEGIQQAKESLDGYLEVAYSAIEKNYFSLDDQAFIEKYFGKELRSNLDLIETTIDEKIHLSRIGILSKYEAQREALQLIENMRYDNGTGYFWITNSYMPTPSIVMHPINPELNGEKLDMIEVDLIAEGDMTVLKAFEKCLQEGESFFQYSFDKPTAIGFEPNVQKVAYAREIEEWGWICVTGIYKDDARRNVVNNLMSDLKTMRFDNGNGFFWIMNDSLPNPIMLMHPTNPELEGQHLTGSNIQLVGSTTRNVYQEQVASTLQNVDGKGFLAYNYHDEILGKDISKMVVTRRFEPLGWVIATGTDTDSIIDKVAIKEASIKKQINRMIAVIASAAILMLALGIYLAWYYSKAITNAVVTVKDRLQSLSLGKSVEIVQVERKDEIGEMVNSLDSLVNGIENYTAFARQIGNGNLDETFEPLSKDDVLGNALLLMRDNLKINAQKEEKRLWINEGVSSIGEAIRVHSDSLNELTEYFLKSVIKYLNVRQGAVFILTKVGNQEMLEMQACYAYNRRKYLSKKMRLGEGLAGQCALEREKIYLKKIPESYLNIRSGLGDAVPGNLLFVPLIAGEQLYGVLELAAFRLLEEHEIELVEKISTIFSGTIASVKTNGETSRLLRESQQLTEQLRSQEEELRQNHEEMQATQEEMQRRQLELSKENEELKKALERHSQAVE